MRKLLFLLSFVYGSVAADPPDQAPLFWTRAGLTGHQVFSLCVVPGNGKMLFAATPEGAFFTENAGRTWVGFSDGLETEEQRNLNWITVDPGNASVVYTGGVGGAFKSVNGERWEQLNVPRIPGLDLQVLVDEIAVDPADSNNVLIAGSSNLHRSIDGGQSFEPVPGVKAWTVQFSRSNPDILFAGRFADVSRSIDNGQSFVLSKLDDLIDPESASVTVRRVAPDPHDADRVLLYTSQGSPRLSISTDGGVSFPVQYGAAYPSSDISDLAIDPVVIGRVVTTGAAYGLSGSFESMDGGQTWGELTPAASTNRFFQQLAFSDEDLPDERLFAGSTVSNGVWVLASDLIMFTTFEANN